MPTSPPSAVLLDLDGTIVQTRHASWEIFHQVSNEFGLGIEEPQGWFDILRDNMFEGLRQVCSSDEQVIAVKDEFYRRLSESYNPELVPGITAVIRTLATHCPVSVVSSNSMAVLRRVLTDSDLGLCISHVFGGDIVESKRAAISQFLADSSNAYARQCQGPYAEEIRPGPLDPGRTVLVTDTIGDVREAREAGIRAVGVSWGMHTPEDLLDAGAEFVAIWPQELISHLLGDLATRPLAAACALPIGNGVNAREDGVATSSGGTDRLVDAGGPGGGCAACRCGSGCPGRATPALEADDPAADSAAIVRAAADRRRQRRSQAVAASGPTPCATLTCRPQHHASDEVAAAVRVTCA